MLLQTDPFSSNRSLKAVFVDPRLSDWRPAVPESDNELERAEHTILYLHKKFSSNGEWGLRLLLLVLCDRLDPNDALRRGLELLASELALHEAGRQIPPLPSSWSGATPQQLDRRRILNNVRQTWIAGVLDQSLAAEVRLELGKEYRPDALVREMVVRRPDAPDRTVPSNTGIRELFEQSGRSLLILGEPGSGKTFTLLELARDLLNAAEVSETAALPLVFNLASWSKERWPLEKWLVEEMLIQYQVPRKRSRQLLDEGQLLFLLDGLDEVDPDYRKECVRALNTFLADHLAGVAVCSRSKEYQELTQQLNLSAAIFIRPLSEKQIAQFLQETDLDEVAAVRETAFGLQELTDSPLILNMMALAYQGLELGELATLHSPDAFRRHLFRTYTERIFYHRYRAPQFSPEQARAWLRWMAKRMVQHNQPIFDPFRMQPNWMEPIAERRFWVGVALFGGLLVAFGANY